MKKILALSVMIAMAFNVYGQGKVLKFNGVDSYVDLDTIANNMRTLELWFKLDDDVNSSNSKPIPLVLRNTNNSNANEFGLYFLTQAWGDAGKLEFSITESLGGSEAVQSDSDTWNKNQWYNVAVVIDPVKGMSMYIDGVKQKDTLAYTKTPASMPYSTHLGNWGNRTDLDRYFKGCIDQVAFSKQAKYSESYTPLCVGFKTDSLTIELWDFDKDTSDSLIGAVNQKIAKNHKAELVLDGVCEENAISFNGTDSYVNLGDSVANNARTFEVIFKLKNDVNSLNSKAIPLILRNTDNNNTNEFGLYFLPQAWGDAGKLEFSITESLGGSEAVQSDSDTWNKDQWYSVAVVIDSVKGMSMYVDGVKQQDTLAYNKAPSYMNYPTHLGNWGNLTSLDRYFDGEINQVRISPYALYQGESYVYECNQLPSVNKLTNTWEFTGSNSSFENNIKQTIAANFNNITRVKVEGECEKSPLSVFDWNSVSSNQNVIVYPNPTNDKVNFKVSGFNSVLIYNSYGELVLEGGATDNELLSLDVSSLIDGVYFYSIIGGKESLSGSFVKK